MKTSILLFFLAFILAATTIAQEDQQPQKHKNVTWHNVVMIDYKPGKVWRAKEIIKKFETAGANAGTPGPEKFWFASGKYDLMVIWKFENGPSDLEWSRTENNIKWRKAFVKLMGSEEKANELQKEYQALVASTTNNICRKQLD